jgi:hypothetical protein
MTTKLLLEEAVKDAQVQLNISKDALEEFNSHAENNVFESLEDAESELNNNLYNRAAEACEGSYCCGLEQYRQEFYVKGEKYVAILNVEYNRHDKTYYYIDYSDFRIEKL